MSDLNSQLVFRTVKIFDIGYITLIYFIVAVIFCLYMDKYMGKFDPRVDDQKSLLYLYSVALLHIWFIGVVIYIVRNLVELIPSPFHGLAGFDHFRVKELGNAFVFAYVVLYYQYYYRSRLDYLFTRTKKKLQIEGFL